MLSASRLGSEKPQLGEVGGGHRIRNGERSLTLNILTIFMQKLPEVIPEVTYYIMRRGNDADKEEN